MQRPLPPQRKKAKGIFWIFLLLLLGGGAYLVYTKYLVHLQPRQSIAEPTRYQEERPLMGTLFQVTLYAPDEETAQKGFAMAFARGEEINQIASDYLPESELSLFNAAPADEWVPASKDLLTLMDQGLDLAELTRGAYDPTLGTLTQLWRETKRLGTLPDEAALREARNQTGWEKMQVDLREGRMIKFHPGLRLDLGGIAKGYAADEMLASLEKLGIRSALVLAGGDVRCSQAPPKEDGWRVGLKDRFGELSQSITVAECAVSTSGDLQQFVEIEGQRYSHIIDPTTGLGITESVMATVISPRGQMTDPLATAACINPSFVSELSPSTDIHSRIINRGETLTSSGFPELVPLSKLEEKTEEEKLPTEPEAAALP